ncbi:MAG: hypothetical protein JWL69_4585 [Phycisphaerales bacterium]|nr:hypothetical protein [Phycisphaerales bacterium]MDB5354697.1 hypothetical protein [Phycisphaerales bacterium]
MKNIIGPSLLLALGLLPPISVRAENWPAWRGPEGTGVSTERELPLKWSETENVRTHVPLPDRGNSTPVIWKDRIFVTQAVEKEHRRTVMCFARADGKLLWQSGVTYEEHEPTNGQNPYCAASPVTDGERVIAYFGSAGVFCYDFDGKELWRRDLDKVDSWHGSGASPVIYQDLCIVNAGPGTHASLAALNKRTGEVVWKIATATAGFGGPGGFGRGFFGPRGGPRTHADEAAAFDKAAMAGDMSAAGGFVGSWSTPLVTRVGDHDELIVSGSAKLAGYDPNTGKELWTCKGMTEQVFSSPTAGEGVLVAAGKFFSGGTQVMAVKIGGSGDVTETHRLWTQKLPKECVGSPVITGGRVYLATQFGSLVCLDLSSGKKLAEQRMAGAGSTGGSWSSIVLAAGKLFIVNQSGEVFVVDPSPELKVLETNAVGDETTCASLAISDGQIFLRTYKSLWCFAKAK